MKQIGEVSEVGSYHQMLESFGIERTEEAQQEYIEDYAHMKHRYIAELGLIFKGQLSFVCNEDCDQDAKVQQIISGMLLPEKYVRFVCPIFAVDCVYVEIPGCRYGVQFCSDEGIGGVTWNTVDTEALGKWFKEQM